MAAETNEAAERLREAMQLRHGEGECFDIERLDQALAAERRATVERIRLLAGPTGFITIRHLAEILDEEAAR